jgi:hypothetical protein
LSVSTENETAMVIKKFREIDPNFQMEPFLREMRDYMLPEVLIHTTDIQNATIRLESGSGVLLRESSVDVELSIGEDQDR